jgi:hypothetical protein
MFSAMKCGVARVIYLLVCWAKGPPTHGQPSSCAEAAPTALFGVSTPLLVGMRGFEPPTF